MAMPVLPLVDSMRVSPGFIIPLRSASSIMLRTGLSFMLMGFKNSHLAYISALSDRV